MSMTTVYRAFSGYSRRVPLPAIFSCSPSYSTRTARRRTLPEPQTYPPPRPPLAEIEFLRAEDEAELKDVEMVFDRPRPSEIPFQSKVVNSVKLIGTVQLPVRMYTSPEGTKWAATFLYQEKTSELPYLGIPIIFEGDLAHTAACHLKEKDNIYVSGRLSTDPLPVTLSNGQANVQVMVQDINFVGGSPDTSRNGTIKQELSSDGMKKATSAALSSLNSWDDLVNDPIQWRDYRNDKRNGSVKPKYPDFKHKEDGRALWISSAPRWILPKLEGLNFDAQVSQEKESKSNGSPRPFEESWKDLVDNPNKWWDNRSNKVSERSPDFKHKDTRKGLWLNYAPAWVLENLSMIQPRASSPLNLDPNKDKMMYYCVWRDWRPSYQ